MAAVLPTDHERRAAIVTVHGEDLSPAGVAVLGGSLDQQEIAWLCSHRCASSNIGVIQRQSPEAFSSPPSEAQLQGQFGEDSVMILEILSLEGSKSKITIG
jgi:hypothetical protein